MEAQNFTAIQNRVKRVYAIEDIKISSTGYATPVLKTVSISLGVATVLGVIVCGISGQFLYWPFINNEFNPAFLVFFVGAPIAIGTYLETGKIRGQKVKTVIAKVVDTLLNKKISSDGKKFTTDNIKSQDEVI